MILRAALATVVVAIAVVGSVPAAGAAVREGAGADPRDQPAGAGGLTREDLEQLRVRYDGQSLLVTWRVYRSFSTTAGASNTLRATVSRSRRTATPSSCGGFGELETAQVTAYRSREDDADVIRGNLKLNGFSGGIDGVTSLSPDRRELTIAFSSPALAGHDYRCIDGSLGTDFIDDDLDRAFFLRGYGPAECDDGVDNDGDGLTDLGDPDVGEAADPGCRGSARGKTERNKPLRALGAAEARAAVVAYERRRGSGVAGVAARCSRRGRTTSKCRATWSKRRARFEEMVGVSRVFDGRGRQVLRFCPEGAVRLGDDGGGYIPPPSIDGC